MLCCLGGLLCQRFSIGAFLFFDGSAFRDFGEVLAFKHCFVNVEAAVACAVLCYVWVAIVAGADDVAVKFQVACG